MAHKGSSDGQAARRNPLLCCGSLTLLLGGRLHILWLPVRLAEFQAFPKHARCHVSRGTCGGPRGLLPRLRCAWLWSLQQP